MDTICRLRQLPDPDPVPDPLPLRAFFADPPHPGSGTVRRAATARDWRDATALLLEYVDWIEAEAGIVVFDAQPEFARELLDLRGTYSAIGSTLLVATERSEVCGTVAARLHEDRSVEIKRMYVRPSSRGRGHADCLLRAALRHARRAGADSAWLETLPGPMDPAIGLYRRHGFRPDSVAPRVRADGAIVMRADLTGVDEGVDATTAS